MKNKYAQAIENGEEHNFLLGRRQYFYLNRDWNEHDQTSTGMDILEYSKSLPCNDFLDKLNSDLNETLRRSDITIIEFRKLIGLIFFYFVYRVDEKKFQCDWIFSETTLGLLKDNYSKISKTHVSISSIDNLLYDLKSRFGWPGWS